MMMLMPMPMLMRTRLTVVSLALVLGVAVSASVVSAQDLSAPTGEPVEELDSRWLPWLGCWQLWEEQFDPTTFGLSENDEATDLVGRTFVCVTGVDAGRRVELTAVADGRVLVERTLVADGTRREVRDEECAGWEQSDWAFDGQRLFTRAELRCGEEPIRTVRGISLLTSPSTWVDIQIVEADTREHIEIRRYTPVSAEQRDTLLGPVSALAVEPADIRQARRESAVPLNLADVIEASQETAPRVVEALLVETEPRLVLDSAALIALDDAGIDGTVIDLLVALSYPERFVVERRDRGGSWSSGGFGGFGGFYDPVWYGDLYPYYVTPFGYRSWRGGYSPYLIGGVASPFVIIGDNDVEARTGRVVRDRGYTRVRPRDTAGSSRRATPRGRTGSTGTSASAPRTGSSGTSSSGSSGGSATSSSGSGGGGASRGGFSRGGSGSGRTAVPRK